jgi:hypothetical protein
VVGEDGQETDQQEGTNEKGCLQPYGWSGHTLRQPKHTLEPLFYHSGHNAPTLQRRIDLSPPYEKFAGYGIFDSSCLMFLACRLEASP